jgi:hypothetical protein
MRWDRPAAVIGARAIRDLTPKRQTNYFQHLKGGNTKIKADPENKGKKPWEMTLLEWENYAPFGRLIRDKGRYIPGEDSAKTAFKIGELNGYSPRDIAHYYYKNRSGYHQYIADAIKNGKNVPDEIIAKVFKDKAIPKWTKLRDKNAKKKLGR